MSQNRHRPLRQRDDQENLLWVSAIKITALDWINLARHILTALSQRFDYEPTEALTRARVLYYMQTGYYAADLNESMSERLALLPSYLLTYTGQPVRQKEIDTFNVYVKSVQERM